MIRRTKLLVRQYLLPLKTDTLGSSLLLVIGWFRWIRLVRLVNDIPLVTALKDTDGSTVLSDGRRNKYKAGSTPDCAVLRSIKAFFWFGIIVLKESLVVCFVLLCVDIYGLERHRQIERVLSENSQTHLKEL